MKKNEDVFVVNKIFRGNKKIKKKELNFDLACGNKKQVGYIGIDINKKTQADIICDLNKYPWEFAKENSVDNIFCANFIEHLEGYQFYKFFEECFRILKNNGKIYIISPYYTSIRASQDATHRIHISEHTFLYLSKNWRDLNDLQYYNINCNFEVEKVDFSITEDFAGKSQDSVMYAMKHFFNVANDIFVTLKKI